jgi:hypothetical protein
MPSSKGGRSYSDQSYGSTKTLTFGVVTAGTRATAIVDGFVAMNPITVVDWAMSNTTLGTGGSSQWVLAATSANGTAALGTIIFVGTHAAGAVVSGSVSDVASATLPTGGALHLYSVLSTAASLTVDATISYREAFVATDN